ncbi:pyrimidodiazepine synthase-like [Watersipora subatra]|uniref:pyrimidodiazepine synthase-like n=1 Tax=Watersipora subatra TaxID=2589382 RepID=UPI00355B390D
MKASLLSNVTLWRFIIQSRSCHTTLPSYLISQSKHLTAADPCPELLPDTLRLYSMKWCPFAQRTRLALAHKQIRHEEINVNLSDKPAWLLQKNPEGTVPLLELKTSQVEGVIGSLECCEWLDKLYPESPPVSNIPSDLMSSISKASDEVAWAMYGYIYNKIDVGELEDSLRSIEKTINPSPFLAGSQVTVADFLTWPMFERLLAKGYIINSKIMPQLSCWVDTMSRLPAVTDVRNSSQGYHKYWSSQKSGLPEYDM